MNDANPPELNLDDVLAFNQTLLRLEQAGIPIGVGDSDSTHTLRSKIDSINSKIAMAIARGSSVRQILDSNEVLPFQYRMALSTWLLCDQSPSALAALSDQASERSELERVLSYSMLQPLVIAGLVYLGFLYLIFGIGPKLESISSQIGVEPGIGLRFMQISKRSAWYWAAAIPVSVALAAAIWNWNQSRWSLNFIPGRKKIADAIGNANKARWIRNLLEQNRWQCASVCQTGTTQLLRWALSEELSREKQIDALAASAKVYQGIAKSQSKRVRVWLPALVGASLGGLLVLFFSLTLFGPIVELLAALTGL